MGVDEGNSTGVMEQLNRDIGRDIDREKYERYRSLMEMREMAFPARQKDGGYAPQVPDAAQERLYSSADLEKMVSMRLRTPIGSFFKHWHMYKIGAEKVVILVIDGGQPIVLEDLWPLFPSDALITSLRLLEK